MRNSRGAITLFFILFIGAILVLIYIFFHIENLRIGYKIETIKKERDKLKEEVRILQVERAKLRNLKRVEKMARELGMRGIERDQVVILSNPEIKVTEKILEKRKIASKEINPLFGRREKE